jgi:serine/threonine protein phosphatase PrpC
MNVTLKTAAGNPENQDRGTVIHSTSDLILVVADGAGGRTGGAEAATLAVEFVRRQAHELHDSNSCVRLLREMEEAIAKAGTAGETTYALAVITELRIYGASVGDSGIWVVDENGFIDLTQGQSRKPFVGSGAAWPVAFAHDRKNRKRATHLLLATDGLLKYTSADRVVESCRDQDLELAAQQIIELVRYPSGTLPDDVTVILAALGQMC